MGIFNLKNLVRGNDRQKIKNRISDTIRTTIMSRYDLQKHFSVSVIIGAINKNPYYADMCSKLDAVRYQKMLERAEKERLYQQKVEEKRRRIAEINEQIIATMPADVKNLYPAARMMERNFILHIGPTNSGKTYQAMQAFRNAKTGVYLGPLRLLAYEVYEDTNAAGVPCNMVTGEEEILTDNAKHTASTIELMDENEEKVAKYLKKNGYWRVKVTQASRDLGVDITCRKGLFKKYAVQCKRYSTPVGVQAVQEVVAGKKMYRCNSAMVITNSRFTKTAELLAQKNKVKLIAEING